MSTLTSFNRSNPNGRRNTRPNTRSHRAIAMTVLTGLAVVACVLGFSGVASATEKADNLQVIVRYDELNIASPRGAAVLYSRLQKASRQVCKDLDGGGLSRHVHFQHCVRDTLAKAVADLNRTEVTALHQREVRLIKAS